MQEQLKELGLTNNEIKVYLALLEIGEDTVGPLIKKLDIHRQIAYDALSSLEQKNMVIKITKNGRNNYRVANPQNVLDNIKNKERIAQKLIAEVNKMINEKREEQEIKIYEGKDACINLFLKNDRDTPQNHTNFIITSANDDWEKVMTETAAIEKQNKIAEEKSIKAKLIYEEKDRKNIGKIKKSNTEYKFIDRGIGPPIEIAIWHDSVAIISFGQDIFAIKVKNKNFKEMYLKYFDKLWKMAKR